MTTITCAYSPTATPKASSNEADRLRLELAEMMAGKAEAMTHVSSALRDLERVNTMRVRTAVALKHAEAALAYREREQEELERERNQVGLGEFHGSNLETRHHRLIFRQVNATFGGHSNSMNNSSKLTNV